MWTHRYNDDSYDKTSVRIKTGKGINTISTSKVWTGNLLRTGSEKTGVFKKTYAFMSERKPRFS